MSRAEYDAKWALAQEIAAEVVEHRKSTPRVLDAEMPSLVIRALSGLGPPHENTDD